jgi:homospermidine synthase
MIAGPKLEAEFANAYGERFVLRVNPSRRIGEFLGDETDWKPIKIRDDRLQADFLLADDEWTWLERAWLELTGRRLQKPVFTLVCELLKLRSSE